MDFGMTNIRQRLMGDYALDNWHQHRVDRENFIIYVGSDPRQEQNAADEAGVEHHMADRLELNLNILHHLDPKRPVLVQLGTCGGDWDAGMQMFGALLTASNPITVLGVRHNRSMSSIIPLAADKFVMRPPTPFMYHYGHDAYEGLAGEPMWTWFEEAKKYDDLMLRIYVARLKEQGKFRHWHPAKIRHMLEDNLRRRVDHFLSTDEAVEWGFADGVALGPVERAIKKNTPRRSAMMAALRKGK
jgi:ATP-dependent protease ClpP protease subunit